MKTALALFCLLSIGIAPILLAFSIPENGENFPVVHSFERGAYYVRSVPLDDYSAEGTTKLYRVKKQQDELIQEFQVYMRGELFLAWLPLLGEWTIIQLEPERIRNANDFDKEGKISRLIFYRGGKQIREYSHQELSAMGLRKHLHSDAPRHLGDFTVQGVMHRPENVREFWIKKKTADHAVELVRFDVSTGKLAKPQ